MADTFKVTERVYVDENDNVVPEDSPAARWQVAAPGDEIPLEDAKRYGLTGKKSKAKADDEEKAKPKAANKAKRAAKTKSRRK